MRRAGITVAFAISLLASGCASDGSGATSPSSSVDATTSAEVTIAPSPTVAPTASVETSDVDVPTSPTGVAPGLDNGLVADHLPRGLAAVIAVVGEDWSRLDYIDRTAPAYAQADDGLVEFGVTASESVASVSATLEAGNVIVIDGGVDAATLRPALVAAGSTAHVVDGIEVFPVPKTGSGLPQLWFGFDSVAFVDDFLVLIERADATSPEAADVVGSIVAARDTEPVGADATVALLEQVVGAPYAWAFVGGSTAEFDLRRAHSRASQRKMDELWDESGGALAPRGLLRGAVGLGLSTTTLVAEFATPSEATSAADAYRTIWDTGTSEGRTWSDLIGPISIAPDGNLVIGTSEQLLDIETINPMTWAAES